MPVVPDDPFSGIKSTSKPEQGANPREVNLFHAKSDVDSSTEAQHHTLGAGANQSSPGNHTHNGRDSKRIMEGMVVTGSTGGNAALQSLLVQLQVALGFTNNTT